MKKEEKIDYDVVDECFHELHRTVADYLYDNYGQEAYTASIYLMGNNILTWARTYNVNVEQFMEKTFTEISKLVGKLEKE